MNTGRVWVASEVYYPDEQATGASMTKIAEGLAARGMIVKALTAQPHSGRVASHEMLNGVEVFRCWSTHFSKNNLPGRLLNVLAGNITMLFAALWRIRRDELVLVVTSPPTLPFVIMLACLLKRAKCIVRVDDMFPENAIASGIAKEGTLPVKLIRWAIQKLYRSMDHIVVLGRDMKALMLHNLGGDNPGMYESKISIIPNWADIDEITPMPRTENKLLSELGLQDKFVIQYAGNMGFVHDIETIITAANMLRDHAHVHFLFIGSGAKQKFLEAEIQLHGLTNITRIGQQPRSEQKSFLNACDIAIMALLPGMLGVAVPSRSYNILAAGKPILGVFQEDAEIALMIAEEDVGWRVEAQNPAALADKILEVSKQSDTLLPPMRERARKVAVGKYTAEHALEKFRAVFANVTSS